MLLYINHCVYTVCYISLSSTDCFLHSKFMCNLSVPSLFGFLFGNSCWGAACIFFSPRCGQLWVLWAKQEQMVLCWAWMNRPPLVNGVYRAPASSRGIAVTSLWSASVSLLSDIGGGGGVDRWETIRERGRWKRKIERGKTGRGRVARQAERWKDVKAERKRRGTGRKEIDRGRGVRWMGGYVRWEKEQVKRETREEWNVNIKREREEMEENAREGEEKKREGRWKRDIEEGREMETK